VIEVSLRPRGCHAFFRDPLDAVRSIPTDVDFPVLVGVILYTMLIPNSALRRPQRHPATKLTSDTQSAKREPTDGARQR